jgi:hypothetical protein
MLNQKQEFDSRPSDKFCVMNREFYNELKLELTRIKTVVNVEKAVQIAERILKMLEDKFENRVASQRLKKLDTTHPILSDPRNAPNLINPDNVRD